MYLLHPSFDGFFVFRHNGFLASMRGPIGSPFAPKKPMVNLRLCFSFLDSDLAPLLNPYFNPSARASWHPPLFSHQLVACRVSRAADPCIRELRKVGFPNGKALAEDRQLYSRMKSVTQRFRRVGSEAWFPGLYVAAARRPLWI
ncbi:hypothetical protein DM02DRAFT_104037 [Periconia macrospinosa]|uniref:Uncharacterized protein n=1 Tax=Periconia macrospinosa TaxID=97972 RepID=A0A2V1CXW2_9PLEO|nr:hypothetical protein DM02DRAFT_104037 [Periconia macrospinosa]